MPDNISQLPDKLQIIINDITSQKDIQNIIEQIFDKSNNLDMLRTALTLSLSQYIKAQKAVSVDTKPIEHESKTTKQNTDKEISKFVNDVMELHGINNKNVDISNIRARKDFKRIVAHFTIYEIYKVMNPKRIAGESKKMNYAHNLIQGGAKLASKYEGGREADLKKYGENEVQKLNKSARKIKKFQGVGF